jgi:AcrR family transcriptional regulator
LSTVFFDGRFAAVRRHAREKAREARTEVYRRHILEAAERVFAERGFEPAKLQEISAQAGLSMGTIYAIFPGKTELFTALLEERGQELLRLVREVAADGGEPRDTLERLCDVYVGWFVAHPDFLRTHLRSGVSWALGPALATGTQVQCWQDIHREQSAIFRRGVEAGTFVDEDPEFLAKLFSVTDQVLLADWVAGGMRASREALVARLRAQIERSFCASTPRAKARAARG